jgi:hypothetical protein
LLYASVKTGLNVNIGDMGLNVLIDLINYSAEIESVAVSGKSVRKTVPMSVADLTKTGKVRL